VVKARRFSNHARTLGQTCDVQHNPTVQHTATLAEGLGVDADAPLLSCVEPCSLGPLAEPAAAAEPAASGAGCSMLRFHAIAQPPPQHTRCHATCSRPSACSRPPGGPAVSSPHVHVRPGTCAPPAPTHTRTRAGGRVLCGRRQPGRPQGAGAHLFRAARHQEGQGRDGRG